MDLSVYLPLAFPFSLPMRSASHAALLGGEKSEAVLSRGRGTHGHRRGVDGRNGRLTHPGDPGPPSHFLRKSRLSEWVLRPQEF